MDKSTVAIIVAGMTGAVTVLGWHVSHYFARIRDDRTRRIEVSIKQLDRQLEEFYGPLHSLIEQIFNVWNVREKLKTGIPEDRLGDVELFIWQEYFMPLHNEIQELLKTKLYLSEGATIPQSFRKYLMHSTQELFQQRLTKELNVNTHGIKGMRWPLEFDKDVKNSIESIMARREKLLQDLQPK